MASGYRRGSARVKKTGPVVEAVVDVDDRGDGDTARAGRIADNGLARPRALR